MRQLRRKIWKKFAAYEDLRMRATGWPSSEVRRRTIRMRISKWAAACMAGRSWGEFD